MLAVQKKEPHPSVLTPAIHQIGTRTTANVSESENRDREHLRSPKPYTT